MSTYWYFECLDHTPALLSPDEFTQHTDDGAYKAAVTLAGQRPIEAADYSAGTGHFERNARSFLSQHPTCHLGVVSEYGEHRLLTQPTPTVMPCTCPPPATHLGEGPDQDCPMHGDRRAALTTRPSNTEMVPGHPADEFASTPLQPYLDQLNAEVRRMTKRNGSDGG